MAIGKTVAYLVGEFRNFVLAPKVRHYLLRPIKERVKPFNYLLRFRGSCLQVGDRRRGLNVRVMQTINAPVVGILCQGIKKSRFVHTPVPIFIWVSDNEN